MSRRCRRASFCRWYSWARWCSGCWPAWGLSAWVCVVACWLGLSLVSAASLVGGWAQDTGTLLFLRALEGMGVLMITIPAPGLIHRVVSPDRLTRMLGVWVVYMPLGMSLALLIGPFVIDTAGWRGWWWCKAAVSVVMGLWPSGCASHLTRYRPLTCRGQSRPG